MWTLAIGLLFEFVALAINVSTQRVQEAYERSDAFRRHFDQLYNSLNEEYQSKMRDATPTSSASINQKNYIQSLLHQRYGQDLLKLRKYFDDTDAAYDKKKYNMQAEIVDKMTNEESAKKALATEQLKKEGHEMQQNADKLEIYSRRPASYSLMAQKQGKKENK